jgi:RNA polymerase sigma factor (sigma-70 family)
VDFKNIYNCTFQYVYRFFYYKSVNPSSVEDLTHEVFIRFFKKYGDRLIEETEAKRILFGFSSNVYKEWVREQVKAKRTDLLDNYDYGQNDEDDFLDDSYEKKLLAQRKLILEALTHLNPKVRYVLECRFLHGMSRKEIAGKMEISEKDVHTYQKRGVRYLKKIIGGNE